MISSETILLLTPEIIVLGVATSIYVGGTLISCRCLWSWLAALGLLAAGVALYRQAPDAAFNGPLAADTLSHYVRWLALVLGLLFVLLSSQPSVAQPLRVEQPSSQVQAPEIVGSLMMIVGGLMLVSVSTELVLLFTGLELISLPTYVLLYLGRRDAASQEATVKYFFLSILSSALLLYGFSFLYGLGGSTWLNEIAARFAEGGVPADQRPLAVLALVLTFAGLGFRVTAVPFHFYAPDVYQGTTNTNAALLSIVPKIAGLLALVRIVPLSLHGMENVGWRVALILAVLTMTVGNVLGLWQDNIRRLLAYSSIAHAGYMLVALAVAFAGAGVQGASGVAAILFYLGVYAAATIGVFAVLNYVSGPDRSIDNVDELAGLGRTQPLAAVAMSVFLFSLAGVPPLAGFQGKLLIFLNAVGIDTGPGSGSRLNQWFIGLAVVGVLNAAIAAAYYLRIVGAMYFRSPLSAQRAEGGRGSYAAMLACVALVLGIGLIPGPLVQSAERAVAQARLKAAPAGQTSIEVTAGAE